MKCRGQMHFLESILIFWWEFLYVCCTALHMDSDNKLVALSLLKKGLI